MYISTHLPEFNNVTSNTEKLAAGVQKEEEKKKTKLGIGSFPRGPDCGLMKMRKENMKRSSVASTRCLFCHEAEHKCVPRTITLVLLGFFSVKETVTTSFSK